MRPIELAGAYATFAAGGTYEEPRLVTRIVGPDGKDVPLPDPPPPRRVLDDAEAYVVTNMLTSVIDHGTAARAKSLGPPARRQDGDVERPEGHVVRRVLRGHRGRHVGRLRRRASARRRRAGRGHRAAGVDVVHEGRARRHAPRRLPDGPPGVTTVTIDQRTGELPYPDDPDVLDEVFLAGTEPTATAEPPPPDDAGVPDAAP